MVRNAKDVPGLKILNSDLGKNSVTNSSSSGQNFSNNVFTGNTQNAKQVETSEKSHITNSSDSLR